MELFKTVLKPIGTVLVKVNQLEQDMKVMKVSQQPPTPTKMNCIGQTVKLGGGEGGDGGFTNLSPSKIWYCNTQKDCKCGKCNGRCGPTNGCPCEDCYPLVEITMLIPTMSIFQSLDIIGDGAIKKEEFEETLSHQIWCVKPAVERVKEVKVNQRESAPKYSHSSFASFVPRSLSLVFACLIHLCLISGLAYSLISFPLACDCFYSLSQVNLLSLSVSLILSLALSR